MARPRSAGARDGGANHDGEAHFDYTAVGHVTADVMDDGSRRAGGGAFYSALQAARLGQRTRIVTRGAEEEIEELLAPYRAELALEVQPAQQTTALTVSAPVEGERRQRLLAWAGAMQAPHVLETSILHFAPIARETHGRFSGQAGFICLTPQGLVRRWSARGAQMSMAPLRHSDLPERCDAAVISAAERSSCASLLQDETQRRLGAVVAVTAQGRAIELRLPGGAVHTIDVAPHGEVLDDLGAGDVFAAAFFICLRAGAQADEAARFASAAAAVRIAGVGAAAIGDRAAVEARLRAVGRQQEQR